MFGLFGFPPPNPLFFPGLDLCKGDLQAFQRGVDTFCKALKSLALKVAHFITCNYFKTTATTLGKKRAGEITNPLSSSSRTVFSVKRPPTKTSAPAATIGPLPATPTRAASPPVTNNPSQANPDLATSPGQMKM